MLHRTFAVELGDRADGDKPVGPVRYPLSFSSEEPVKRYDWQRGCYYFEVLSHDAADVDLSRAVGGLPLLQSHWRSDHLGSVFDVVLDRKSRQLDGEAEFSAIEKAAEQETLLREGHLRSVSVGYRILSIIRPEKWKEGEIPTYRCKWQPYEVSTEPVPADPKVGFGRSGPETDPKEQDLIDVPFETEGDRAMPPVAGTPPNSGQEAEGAPVTATRTDAQPAPAAAPTAPAAPLVRGTEAPPRDRAAEAAEILEMCRATEQLPGGAGAIAQAADYIRSGATPAEISKQLLDQIATRGPGQPGAEAIAPPMKPRDRARYSIGRALRMHVELADPTGKRREIDGLEAEVHQELAKNRQGTDHGGILIPMRTLNEEELEQRAIALEHRALGTTEPTGGAALVGEQVMPDMIDLLRNRALVLQAGARFYPGLVGNVIFNKKTSAPTVQWIDENPASGATESEPGYGYVAASPKTMIGTVPVPRQLLTQASIDVEQDIRNDLGTGHGLAFDLAALHGSGSNKEPVGIYSADGVLAHAAGGVPDLADIVAMPTLVAVQNADLGLQSWMITPAMAGVMMRTDVGTDTGTFIWKGTFREGSIFGSPARATNQISAVLGSGADEHGMIFGNWNDLAVCTWGNALELVVDIYTRASKGQVVITSYGMGDIIIRRGPSFCKATGAKIA